MKKNKFIPFLIIIIAVALIVIVSKLVLDNTGKINQGVFRVNDLIVKSVVNTEEIQSETTASAISDIKFNASQENQISILVAKDSEAQSIYIDNISIKGPEKKGNIFISESDKEKQNINEIKKIDIYPVDRDGQYLIQLNVINSNFLTNANLPDNTSAVTFDGTLLNTLGIKISEVNFKLNFSLNIVDSTGKVNVCKFKLDIPSEELLSNGISVIREDVNNYRFYIK